MRPSLLSTLCCLLPAWLLMPLAAHAMDHDQPAPAYSNPQEHSSQPAEALPHEDPMLHTELPKEEKGEAQLPQRPNELLQPQDVDLLVAQQEAVDEAKQDDDEDPAPGAQQGDAPALQEADGPRSNPQDDRKSDGSSWLSALVRASLSVGWVPMIWPFVFEPDVTKPHISGLTAAYDRYHAACLGAYDDHRSYMKVSLSYVQPTTCDPTFAALNVHSKAYDAAYEAYTSALSAGYKQHSKAYAAAYEAYASGGGYRAYLSDLKAADKRHIETYQAVSQAYEQHTAPQQAYMASLREKGVIQISSEALTQDTDACDGDTTGAGHECMQPSSEATDAHEAGAEPAIGSGNHASLPAPLVLVGGLAAAGAVYLGVRTYQIWRARREARSSTPQPAHDGGAASSCCTAPAGYRSSVPYTPASNPGLASSGSF